MALKSGFDTVTAKDVVEHFLYSLEDDEGNIIFPDETILTGAGGKVSLYQGLLAFLMVGDLKKVEEGLRRIPRIGLHDTFLWVIVAGETPEAKDYLNNIVRIVVKEIRDDPTLDTDGLKLSLAEDIPIQRRRVSFDDENKIPKTWNSSVMIKLELRLADIP